MSLVLGNSLSLKESMAARSLMSFKESMAARHRHFGVETCSCRVQGNHRYLRGLLGGAIFFFHPDPYLRSGLAVLKPKGPGGRDLEREHPSIHGAPSPKILPQVGLDSSG